MNVITDNKQEALDVFTRIFELSNDIPLENKLTNTERLVFTSIVKLSNDGFNLIDNKMKKELKPIVNKNQKSNTQTNDYINKLVNKGWLNKISSKKFSYLDIFNKFYTDEYSIKIQVNVN